LVGLLQDCHLLKRLYLLDVIKRVDYQGLSMILVFLSEEIVK